MEEIMGMLSSNMMGNLIENGLKATRNMLLLGGQHTSWRSNDLGLPVGVGLSNPGILHYEIDQIKTSIKVHADLLLQVQTYLVAYNPLGVSQGVMKMRGSRLHVPIDTLIGFNAADKQVALKMAAPTKEEPLSIIFSSKTVAFMWGRQPEKAMSYLKESCSECSPVSLVSRGEEFRKGHVIRDSKNERLGMESHIEVYNCESYTGKTSMSKVILESFKPSEINSHGSVPGFAIMGLMQMRNYFYYYPPTTTCSMKAVLHKAEEHPAEAVQIQLSMKPTPEVSGLKTTNIEGSFTIVGDVERKWNVNVDVQSNKFKTQSKVNVKIARQAVPSLDLPSRALCVEVNTKWADIPEDILETPSTIEPSVERDVTFVWGEAQPNECPVADDTDVSTLIVKVNGVITDTQRQAAESRDRYPYNQCDQDKKAHGRTGVVVPITKVSFIPLIIQFIAC